MQFKITKNNSDAKDTFIINKFPIEKHDFHGIYTFFAP